MNRKYIKINQTPKYSFRLGLLFRSRTYTAVNELGQTSFNRYTQETAVSGHGLMKTMNSFLVATTCMRTFPLISNENVL